MAGTHHLLTKNEAGYKAVSGSAPHLVTDASVANMLARSCNAILCDAGRTFTTLPAFAAVGAHAVQRLQRLLSSFVTYNLSLGYCQVGAK